MVYCKRESIYNPYQMTQVVQSHYFIIENCKASLSLYGKYSTWRTFSKTVEEKEEFPTRKQVISISQTNIKDKHSYPK